MKNKIKYAFGLILTIITISCNNNSEDLNDSVSEKFGDMSISKEIGNELKSKLANYNQSIISGRSDSNVTAFDYDDPTMITYDNNNLTTITIPEINNNDDEIITKKAFLLDNNYDIINVIETDLIKLSDTQVEVINYDINGNITSHYLLDTISQNISLTNTVQNDFQNRSTDCGQQVADCMTDEYSNHGWGSVALWIGSAFFPEVIVGVAVICLYESDDCA